MCEYRRLERCVHRQNLLKCAGYVARIGEKRFLQNLVENMKESDCLKDLCLTLQLIFIKYEMWCVLNSSESGQIPLMIRCLTGTKLLTPLQRDEILDWLRQ